jgi:hypothetical protein
MFILLIEAYFQQLLETLNLCLIVQASRVTYTLLVNRKAFLIQMIPIHASL